MTEDLFTQAARIREGIRQSKLQLKKLNDLKGYAPTRTLRVIIPNYFNDGVDVPNEIVDCFLHMIELHYANQVNALTEKFIYLGTDQQKKELLNTLPT